MTQVVACVDCWEEERKLNYEGKGETRMQWGIVQDSPFRTKNNSRRKTRGDIVDALIGGIGSGRCCSVFSEIFGVKTMLVMARTRTGGEGKVFHGLSEESVRKGGGEMVDESRWW